MRFLPAQTTRHFAIAAGAVALFFLGAWVASQQGLTAVDEGASQKFLAVIYHGVSAMLKLAAIWLGALGLGLPVRLWLARGAKNPLFLQMAAGLGVLLSLDWLLAAAGLMNPWTAWGVCGLGTMVVTYHFADAKLREAWHPDHWPSPPWTLLLALPAMGVMAVACTCPPGTLWGIEGFGYDVTSYHLQVPREWIELGGMQSLQHNIYSHLPMFAETGYMQLAEMHGRSMYAAIYTTQFFHGSVAVLASIGVGGVTARAAGGAAGGFAAALLLAAPWTLVTGSLAYNEMFVLVFAAAAIALALDEHSTTRRGAVLLGLLLGWATLAKLTAGGLAVLPVGAAWVRTLWRHKREKALNDEYLALPVPMTGPRVPTAWPAEFPEVIVHGYIADLRRAALDVGELPDDQGRSRAYAAAKAGDAAAAAKVVEAFVQLDRVNNLARDFSDAWLLPVHAVEAEGINELPMQYATTISSLTGLPIDHNITQLNRVGHTGANALARFARPPLFGGRVLATRKYILIDDTVGTGSTLAVLRHLLVAFGAEVVAATTLAELPPPAHGAPSRRLPILPLTVTAISKKFDRGILEATLHEYEIAPTIEHLTESQGRLLLGRRVPTVDALRTAIVEARREKGTRLRDAAVCSPEAQQDLTGASPASRRRAAACLLPVAIAAIVFLAVLAPYLLRNALSTGNPVFPFATSLLGRGHWDESQVERWNKAHHAGTLGEGIGKLGYQWLLNTGYGAIGGGEPDRQATDIARFETEGGLPVLWLLAAAGAALAWRQGERRGFVIAMLVVLAAQIAFWVVFTHQQSRFLIPTLLPGCVLAGLALARITELAGPTRKWVGPLTAIGCVLVLTMSSLTTFWSQTLPVLSRDGQPQRLPPWVAIDSLAEPLDVTINQPGKLTGTHPLNNLAPGGRVLMLFDAMRPLYIRRPFGYATAFDRSPLTDLLREHPGDANAVTTGLLDAGYLYVWINLSEYRRLSQTYGVDAELSQATLQELAKSWIPVMADRNVALFRLPSVPPPP